MNALFWATLAIALGTFVLAIGTVLLALTTLVGVGFQWRELKAVEEQVRLTKEQFRLAQAAARPQLDIDVVIDEGTKYPASGEVRYIHGSEPAYDIEVWIKTRTQSFGGRAGTILTPSTASWKFMLDGIPDEMFNRWPIPEAHKAPVLEKRELWAGVTWRSPDGTRGSRRYKQLADLTRDENPEVMEPYNLPDLERDRLPDWGFSDPPPSKGPVP